MIKIKLPRLILFISASIKTYLLLFLLQATIGEFYYIISIILLLAITVMTFFCEWLSQKKYFEDAWRDWGIKDSDHQVIFKSLTKSLMTLLIIFFIFTLCNVALARFNLDNTVEISIRILRLVTFVLFACVCLIVNPQAKLASSRNQNLKSIR